MGIASSVSQDGDVCVGNMDIPLDRQAGSPCLPRVKKSTLWNPLSSGLVSAECDPIFPGEVLLGGLGLAGQLSSYRAPTHTGCR